MPATTTPRPARRFFSIIPGLLLAAGAAFAQPPEPVQTAAGALPVILTAPHGGLQAVPDCPHRSPAGSRFVNRTDARTDRLARGIADELQRLTGKAPYLVIANFHRRYIDANRPAEEAYAAPGCAAAYDAYHAAIRSHVDDIRSRFPQAMLFDIHGQAAYREAILRGTRHGTTVQALLARAGAPALTGPDSVFGRFAMMGYAIVPDNDTDPADRVEAPGYSGGHTVNRYGSHRPDGIDAIQLEFGLDLRDAALIDKTARDTAQAIAVFYRRFLE
jgi:N-formylglutamate amidohydrolase